jgi:hypothetical protein
MEMASLQSEDQTCVFRSEHSAVIYLVNRRLSLYPNILD